MLNFGLGDSSIIVCYLHAGFYCAKLPGTVTYKGSRPRVQLSCHRVSELSQDAPAAEEYRERSRNKVKNTCRRKFFYSLTSKLVGKDSALIGT